LCASIFAEARARLPIRKKKPHTIGEERNMAPLDLRNSGRCKINGVLKNVENVD
jgi:hypothetical protein